MVLLCHLSSVIGVIFYQFSKIYGKIPHIIPIIIMCL